MAKARARAARRSSEVGRAVGAAIVAGVIYDLAKKVFMWAWNKSKKRTQASGSL